MSKFDKKTLSNLEKLCKIKLSEDEKIEFEKKLKEILDYVQLLNEVDTTNVDECNFILKGMQNNFFREDIVNNTLDRQTFLANAPDKISGMIKVFEILSQKE